MRKPIYANTQHKQIIENYIYTIKDFVNEASTTNGFFAGLETKRNSTKINSYRMVLNDMLQNLIDKIEKFETINE